jgi:hypothetical protein
LVSICAGALRAYFANDANNGTSNFTYARVVLTEQEIYHKGTKQCPSARSFSMTVERNDEVVRTSAPELAQQQSFIDRALFECWGGGPIVSDPRHCPDRSQRADITPQTPSAVPAGTIKDNTITFG